MRFPRIGNYTLIAVLPLVSVAAGCGKNLDSAMWECQLDVQKGNAGRSPEALAERARDIEACMAGRGFKLDTTNRDCQPGATNSTCYIAK